MSKEQSVAWLRESSSGKKEVFCDRRPLEPLVFPIISVAVHPLVHTITGFTNILFSTLGACYKVDTLVVLQLVLHLSLIVAPLTAICVEVIILQVLHLALPHGRVSPSGSSSRMSGLSLARARRSHRLLGLL